MSWKSIWISYSCCKSFIWKYLTSQTYQWTVTGQSTIISTLQAVSSLAVGSYTCTVIDASFPGCSISGSVNVDTSAVAVKIDNLELVEISCHNATDGEITVHASGGTPPYNFFYKWNK